MCGIAGELRFNAGPCQANWPAISELMKRRGPNDEGDWENEHCSFVFRRLSIIDLSKAGHQPMLSENGQYALVFNGEVYNFKELRRELEGKGVTFRSNSDSEVVLYSLIEWGKNALNRFNGMFALGFYDIRARKLLLARDHAGIKPLYYLKHPSLGLMFGSQYDQLLEHPWSKGLAYSANAATLYFRLASIPAPYGVLENTYAVEPGGWLEVSCDGKIHQGIYYEFPWQQKPTLFGQEAMEAVDSAITSAVKRQLVSDVPIGAFLSGGIDSPLICAKMQEVSSTVMRAFTIGTEGDRTDESQDAIEYAKQLGIDHIVKHVSSNDAIDMLDDVVKACGEPFGDFSIFPTLLVCKLASQDFTVMLSGDGGDELFWGYANRFGDLMDGSGDFKYSARSRYVMRNTRRLIGLSPKFSRYNTLGDWQLDKQSRNSSSLLGQLFPELPAWPSDYEVYDFDGYQLDDTARWIRKNEFVGHLSGVLLKVDRASMFHSLEVRVPLLDREVVDIAAKVDWRDCFDMSNRTGKIPLRKSLAKHIQFQSSAKKGFEPPMRKWLQTTLRPVVEDVLLTKETLLGVPIDRKALRAYYQQHLDGNPNANGWGFWPLLSAALWENKFGR